jgi:PST family polysaccharide transporter
MNIIPAFVRRRIVHRPNLIKIIENIGWLFFDKVLRMGMGLLVGVWVARYLGAEQFGLLSFALAFVGIFASVAGLGIQSIVVRDIVRDPNCKEETLGTTAVLQLLGGLIAYCCAIITIFWLRPEDTLGKLLVAIIGSSMLSRFSDVALYWFESQVLFKYIVWVQNGCFLIFAAIKVALIVSNAPLIAFAWAAASEALMVAVLMSLILELRGPKIHQLRFSFLRAKKLTTDSWPLLLSGMAIMIYMKIDQIMLGQMLGDDAVGIYSAAVRLSEVWYFIPMTIVTSVFPYILETKKRDNSEYLKQLQRLYDLMVCLSVAIALPMTVLSTPIVIALFGSSYADSGPILAIHIWASVFVFLGVASNQWFIAENRLILGLQRAFLGLLINVFFNIILIPKFGTVGAAIATLLGQIAAAWLFDLIQPVTRIVFLMKLRSFNLIRTYPRFIKEFKKWN